MKTFRMQYLEEQYKMHSFFKDSLLTRYGQKLDNIYDKKVGCLDTRALNFNPNANTDCEGCCRYSKESPLYSSGCMDKAASNYRERYTEPCDTCCIYPPVTLSFGEITDSTIEIYMQNPEAVGGFQFDLTGGSILSGTASGGSAADNGLSVSSGGTRVIGFSFGDDSIPIGSGLLTIVGASLVSDPICIENVVLSDVIGDNLEISISDINGDVGTDSCTYQANDGALDSDISTISLIEAHLPLNNQLHIHVL